VYSIGRIPTPETPMLTRALPIAVLALALAALPAAAQTAEPVVLYGCAYAPHCGPFPQPVGLYVSDVQQDGRYLALEDGSLWEVEISDRATTASWLPVSRTRHPLFVSGYTASS